MDKFRAYDSWGDFVADSVKYSDHEQAMAELKDALIHIADVANRSRSQSRRDGWIQARAESAINGNDDWKEMVKPKNPSNQLLRQRIELKEKDVRIARLEYGLNNQLKGDLHINGVEILNESPQISLSNIKVDAIREMINKTNCQDPAMRVVQDMLDYANKLRSNK